MRCFLHTRRRELLNDDALHVFTQERAAFRNGNRVRMSRVQMTILIALLIHEGRRFSNAELCEIAFGDDPRGGPDNASKAIDCAFDTIKIAAPILGIVVTRRGGFTSIRPLALGEQTA